MDIRPIDANALMEKRRMMTEDKVAYNVMCDAIPAYLVDSIPTLSLNTLRDAIYQDAVAHGLWEGNEALCNQTDVVVNEVMEMLEASAAVVLSSGQSSKKRWKKKKHFAEELADIVIACFSLAGKRGIDIDAVMRRKMEINKQRPWKHGKEEKV